MSTMNLEEVKLLVKMIEALNKMFPWLDSWQVKAWGGGTANFINDAKPWTVVEATKDKPAVEETICYIVRLKKRRKSEETYFSVYIQPYAYTYNARGEKTEAHGHQGLMSFKIEFECEPTLNALAKNLKKECSRIADAIGEHIFRIELP